MQGKITFLTLEELATFLKAFTGGTAIFEVKTVGQTYVLEFTGGY